MTMTNIRLRSACVQPEDKNIQPMNATIRPRSRYPAASATCVGETEKMPLYAPRPKTMIAATVTPIHIAA
jgi:hypothetical protein